MLSKHSFDNVNRSVNKIIILNFLAVYMLHAQIMNEGSIHLPLPSARGAAMGEAYTGEISDVSIMYWNPGSLPFLERTALILDHYYETQSGLMNDVIATPVWIAEGNAITIGGALSHLDYLGSGQVSSQRVFQSGINLSYARILAPGLSVGLTGTATYIDIEAKQRWTSSWMAGLTYYPSPEISYGIVFNDVLYGAQIQHSAILVKEELPRRLEMGISMRYPVSRKRRIVTLSLANEKIFNEAGLLYKGGLEVYPFPFVAVRWGYIAG